MLKKGLPKPPCFFRKPWQSQAPRKIVEHRLPKILKVLNLNSLRPTPKSPLNPNAAISTASLAGDTALHAAAKSGWVLLAMFGTIRV